MRTKEMIREQEEIVEGTREKEFSRQEVNQMVIDFHKENFGMDTAQIKQCLNCKKALIDYFPMRLKENSERTQEKVFNKCSKGHKSSLGMCLHNHRIR